MAVYKTKEGRWRAEPYYLRKLPSKVFATESEALSYEYEMLTTAKSIQIDVREIPLELFTLKHLISYWRSVRTADVEGGIFSRDGFDRMNDVFTYIESCEQVAKKVVRNLTPDDIDRLISHWWSLPTAQSKKRKSFLKDLKYFRTLLGFYKERKRDHQFHSPILKIHRQKCMPLGFQVRKPAKALLREDVLLWLEAVKDVSSHPVYYHLAYVMLHTGMRRGEALGLEGKHIDFKNQIISIEQQVIYSYKTGKPSLKDKLKTAGSRRKVHFGESVRDILKKLAAARPIGLIFSDGKNEFLPKNTIQNVFNRAFDKASPGLTGTHVCRRTFVTLGTSATSLEAVQRAVGHSSRITTEGYFDLESQSGTNVSQGIENLLRT
jgi:integrase